MTYNLLNVLQSPKCFEGSDLQNCKLTHNHKFIPSSFISTRFILLMVIGDTEPDNWKSQILPSEKSVQTIQIQIIEQFFSDTDYFLLNDSYKSIYIFATNWGGLILNTEVWMVHIGWELYSIKVRLCEVNW